MRKRVEKSEAILLVLYISKSQLHPAPRLLRGICLPCQSRGWGICKFCAAWAPGICQPRGHSRTFETYAVSYQNITTQRILLGKKANWLICQGQEKIEEGYKGMFLILCMNFSLLIKPELHGEIGSYRRESTFFGY